MPFELSVVRAPIQERRDLSLEQIEALHRASGRAPAHRPFGLYAVQVFYTIEGTHPSAGSCAPVARVDLVLSERVIQLARDVAQGACVTAAVTHYRMHAAANDAVFSRLAERVTAVQRAPALVDGLLAARDAGEVQQIVEAVVEPEMDAYDREDRSAQAKIDNTGEREKLERSCADPTHR